MPRGNDAEEDAGNAVRLGEKEVKESKGGIGEQIPSTSGKK